MTISATPMATRQPPAKLPTQPVRRIQTPSSGTILLYLDSPDEAAGRDSFGRLRSPSGALMIRQISSELDCIGRQDHDLDHGYEVPVDPQGVSETVPARCVPVRRGDGRSLCQSCLRWFSVSHTTTETRIATAVAVAQHPVGVDVQFVRRRAGALRGLARMVGRKIGTVGWPDWVATEALIKAQGRAGVRPEHGTVALPPMSADGSWTRAEESWQILVESLDSELWLAIAIAAPLA